MKVVSVRANSESGEAMVSFALIVVLMGMVGMVALRNVGTEVSDVFEAVASSLPSDVSETTTTTRPLTPDEMWELAQQEYDATIEAAKDKKATDLDKAKADYDAAVDANKSLPKAEKKAANDSAKETYNAAKATVNETYNEAVTAAKDVKAAAKAEWKATK